MHAKKELYQLGKNIVRLRKAKRLTRSAFSKELGVRADKLKKMEEGKINIRFATMVKIAELLGLEISEIFENK